MKYCLLPLGCQMNQSDAERIRAVLEAIGYERTDYEEEAHLLGIVACSVRQKAIDKVYSKIHKWNEWKNGRNLLTFVSGCILPADREKFLDRFDLLFTINELPKLPELIRQYGVLTPLGAGAATAEPDTLYPESRASRAKSGSNGESLLEDIRKGFWRIQPAYSSSFEAYVPIQNGCDKFCTFCAVPYTRGREVSRPSEEILAEVSELVEQGYKTITLLGQNVNSYGLDRLSSEMSFPELLRAVGEIGVRSGKEFWVYFTSPHPRDMTDEVLETIAAYPVLANQIHLPIQSGDDKILIRMNRNYRLAGYRRVVESIRRILPKATLFTDIIVGFTGETEEQFENTRKAMVEFRYNMAYVAIYSPRPGAASSRWADDVPRDEKKHRLHELSQLLQETSMEYNRALIGRELRVLVQGRDRKGFLSGHTEGKLPIRLSGTDREDLVGEFVDVVVTDCAPLSLQGELLKVAAGA
ncbi:MAG: MiaB/RimO family radical SAM methylthiotransferase [Alkalispirochaetaceae bacterium]